MRYYLDTTTLFIRGPIPRPQSTVIPAISGASPPSLTTRFPQVGHASPIKEIELVTAAAGTGLLCRAFNRGSHPAPLACPYRFFITVFVTAGIRQEPPAGRPEMERSTSSWYSSEGNMEDSALLETILVATEAKAETMLADGRYSGTPTDAVIAACEGEVKHRYAGR